MAKKTNLIIEQKIPKEYAEIAFDRISPMIEKYFNEQKLQAKILNYPVKNIFGLKELCFSCYTQGLMDSQQLTQ